MKRMKQVFNFMLMVMLLFSGMGYAQDVPNRGLKDEPLLSENFDHGTESLPSGWTQLAISGSRRWACPDLNGSPSGDRCARHMSGTGSSAMITPAISVPATGDYELSFAFQSGSWINADSHKVMISTTGNDDISKFEDLYVFLNDPTHTLTGVWSEVPIKIDLNAYGGQEVHIAFVYKGGAGAAAWFIDDVEVKQKSNADIKTFPWEEGFEDNGTNLPVGWRQEVIVGDPDHPFWEVVSRGFGDVTEPHSGTYMVRFFGLSGRQSQLFTPSFDLTSLPNPRLKFWQRMQSVGGSRETLKIWYKTSANGEWTLLKEYRGSSAINWAERAVALPNPSDDYYLMFEGISGYGNGIHLDDLVIETTPNIPIISAESTLAFGTVYNNLPIVPSKGYTIFNMGGVDLTISVPTVTSSDLTVTGLPLTIPAMESASFNVALNGWGLPSGAYNGVITFTTNDSDIPEFTIDVTAGILSASVSSYIMETFNEGWPEGWLWGGTFPIQRLDNRGIDDSPCISANVYFEYPLITAQTSYVEMGNDPDMYFHYKAINLSDDLPTGADDLRYSVLVSKDFGATFDEVYSVPAGQHVPSADYTRVDVDLSAYANEYCMVQIVFYAEGAGDYNFYLDDVFVGSQREKELAAVSVTGNIAPTIHVAENYTVSVKNMGNMTQSNYTVRFMQRTESGGVEIGSLPGVAIAANETKEFTFSWTSGNIETVQFYGEVILVGDEYTDNNKTPFITVNSQPASYISVSVGDGTEKYRLPINTYYSKSIAQTLYYPHEIKANSGKIQSLVYKADYVYTENKLENIPVQIWIGETDREDLEAGWVNPTGLTEVYDGVLNFTAGKYDVTIELDTPYEYNGGILTVQTYRKASDYSTTNDGFIGTAEHKSNRSLLYNSFAADINPLDLSSILDATVIHGFPNTTFVLDTEGMGVLSGNITNGMTSLDDVKLHIVGTRLYTMTDAAGNYQFASLAPGSYDIEVSKHGYATQTINVTITANVPSVRNISLAPLSKFTISGKVTGSNAPNGIENVEVILSGYDNFIGITDMSGNYSIQNVFGGFTYDITTKANGYETYNSTIDIANTNLTHDIELIETPYPVLNLVATELNNQAIIRWDAPTSTTQFRYDNGICTGQLGFQAGFESYYPRGIIGSCHRESATLENISWYLTDIVDNKPTTVHIFIFELNKDGQPTSNVIFSVLDVPSTKLEWNTYQFPELVEAPNGFFMAMSHPTTYLAIGLSDPDENYPFKPQTHFYNSDFEIYTPVALDGGIYEKNVMIRAEGMVAGTRSEFGHPVSMRGQYIPTPIGYTIYRSKDDVLTKIDVTTSTTYTDTEWSTLSAGTYSYAVAAEYINNNVSINRYTNTLENKGVSIDNVDISDIQIYSHLNTIYIKNESNIPLKSAQVIDMQGRIVHETEVSRSAMFSVEVTTGHYVVKLVSEDGNVITTKLYLTTK